MIRFLHTADWHLRPRQYGRHFRKTDFERAANEVIDLAIENGCDFIVNGGDTFDSNRPSEEMLDILFKIHGRLVKAGIPMFIVTGNHDASEPSYLRFPDYYNVEGGEIRGGVVCLDERNIVYKGIRIAGLPARVDPNEARTRLEAWKRDQIDPDIFIWHGAVDEFVPFPMENSWAMSLMPEGHFRAALLGDIHLPGVKRLADESIVAYPGPIELCERGEPAKKHVDYYQLEDDWREKPFPDPIPLELNTRPVLFLTAADDTQADQCIEKIRETIRNNPERGPLIFLRYERSLKVLVQRITETINLSDSAFLSAAFHRDMAFLLKGGPVNNGQVSTDGLDADAYFKGSFEKPQLTTVAAEEVPIGHPVYDLVQGMVNPETNPLQEIAKWVDSQMIRRSTAEQLVDDWLLLPDEHARKTAIESATKDDPVTCQLALDMMSRRAGTKQSISQA